MIEQLAQKLLIETLVEKLANVLLGEKVPLEMARRTTGEIILPAYRIITKSFLRKVAAALIADDFEIAPSPVRNIIIRYYAEWKAECLIAAVGYLQIEKIKLIKG